MKKRKDVKDSLITFIFGFLNAIQTWRVLPQLELIFNSLAIANKKKKSSIFFYFFFLYESGLSTPLSPQEEMFSNNFKEPENYKF